MRVGVILPNWLGDVVMATPALRALRKHLGESGHLVGVMRPYVAEVLAGNNWLDDIILYQKGSRKWAANSAGLYPQIRAARLDQIVLMTNSLRTAWIAWRSGVPQRVGYRGEWRTWMLTKRLPMPLQNDGSQIPTIDSYLHLAEAAGCDVESPQLELATTAADEQAADRVWKSLGLPRGEQVIVFNSGGAFGASKQWPAEHFAELARRIVSEKEFSVLINCGPAEREAARDIAARADSPRVVSLAGEKELPVGLAKACIRRARMVVTTDSGPRFFAVAFQRPVVTLFGPTDPKMTVTHYDRETAMSLGLECQPCMERTCPLVHHRCMRDLSVDMVYDAVLKSLAASRTQAA